MTTPLDFLGKAELVLDGGVGLPAAVAARAAAVLTRRALELLLAALCGDRATGSAATTSLLIASRAFKGEDFAVRARHAWSALSRLCHHHAYRLDPDRAEVAGWVVE
ncbi:hypothetical protein, partial [Actinosynnema sp.]|uniref:hypothetical protein n=1 Tax=Actinosynnema sp. TaxID=1872144 RepID=UPI003F8275D3